MTQPTDAELLKEAVRLLGKLTKQPPFDREGRCWYCFTDGIHPHAEDCPIVESYELIQERGQ